MVDDLDPKRRTRRLTADVDADGPLGRKATDRELIADELRSFKKDFRGVEVLVPWNNLKLGKHDQHLKELFKMAGLNPSNVGHWRLLLGIFAEFQAGPEPQGEWIRRYNIIRWTPADEDSLFREAAKIASKHRPPLTYKKIGQELYDSKKFKILVGGFKGQPLNATTLETKLKEVVKKVRAQLKDGHYDGVPAERAYYEKHLKYFRSYNK